MRTSCCRTADSRRYWPSFGAAATRLSRQDCRALQGPVYYGRALARHHNTGRSRHWLGVMATIFRRETLLAYPLDASFLSGEDIDLRWRLSRAGVRMGVSRKTVVSHRFGDTLEFARGQWRADGAGLGRMALTHSGGGLLLLMPLADAVRGVTVTTLRLEPQFIPYYLMHAVFNYSSMIATLWAAATRTSPGIGAPMTQRRRALHSDSIRRLSVSLRREGLSLLINPAAKRWGIR